MSKQLGTYLTISITLAIVVSGFAYWNAGRVAYANWEKRGMICPEDGGECLYIGPSMVGEPNADELKLLTQAIRYAPHKPNLFYHRANQYQLFGDYAKALADYEKCMKLNWQFSTIYWEKAICEFFLNDLETALQSAEMARILLQEEWADTPEDMRHANQWGCPACEYKENLASIVCLKTATEIKLDANPSEEELRFCLEKGHEKEKNILTNGYK